MKIGPFSRRGRSRGRQSVTAADHDMGYDALLVPFGVLEIGRGEQSIDQLWIGLGQSRETSDFIADSLERWWEQRSDGYQRGVTITRSAYRPILARLAKSKTLSKWSVTIRPQPSAG